MSKGKPSGFKLTTKDVGTVKGMVNREDRHHDIAAWFGVNQGRIKDALDGKYGNPPADPLSSLPPKGAPGIKGRRLRTIVKKAISEMKNKNYSVAKQLLSDGAAAYDSDEK